MNKLKYVWHYSLSIKNFCEGIGTITGHGLVHIGVSLIRVRLPPMGLCEIAKY